MEVLGLACYIIFEKESQKYFVWCTRNARQEDIYKHE